MGKICLNASKKRPILTAENCGSVKPQWNSNAYNGGMKRKMPINKGFSFAHACAEYAPECARPAGRACVCLVEIGRKRKWILGTHINSGVR
jgi:hypothetical protein